MKKMLFALVAISAAAVIMIRAININQLDVVFQANVSALAQSEKYDAKVCYVEGSEGVWECALFCDRKTSTSALYTCPDKSYGRKTATSYCIK